MMPLYPSSSLSQPSIINDLPQVNSSQEAKTQLTRPSTRDVFWDKEENFFYMRLTDSAGKIVSFERYEYNPSPEPKMEDLFVSKDKFEEVTSTLEGGIKDVQESIQQLISMQQQSSSTKTTRSRSKSSNATSSESGTESNKTK